MVLARLIQPTSKAEAIGVLEDVGQVPPHLNTLYAALRRTTGEGAIVGTRPSEAWWVPSGSRAGAV